MGIEIINPKEVAFTNKKRTVLMSTRKLHSWLIYYEPGRRDEMHCHNGDQTFHMIAGECTMSFPDGGKVVMTPGMSALISGGSFYQLDNTGDGPMVMMARAPVTRMPTSTSFTPPVKTSAPRRTPSLPPPTASRWNKMAKRSAYRF